MKFSASHGVKGAKTYYKNFMPVEAEMAEMGLYMRKFAISSYLYTEEMTKTAGGEECAYRKAGECVVEGGDVLLFDFDSKYVPVTGAELYEKFKGVSCYISPSKGWSEDLEKYHVVVELSEALPVNKDAFSTIYKAVAQWLGIEGLYDQAMESWTQQIAPHFRTDAPEWCIEGDAIDVSVALDAYVPMVEESSGTFAGDIDTDFVLSKTGEVLSNDAMIALVDREGKQRVHCAAGLEHDGRRDTAFVDGRDGEYYYHCSGGRCGHTKRLVNNPFAEEEETETEVREITLATIIGHSRVFAPALDPKAPKPLKEAALNFALSERTESHHIAKVEGSIKRFNGVYWREAFDSKESIRRYLRGELITSGFDNLAYDDTTSNKVYSHYTKHLPVKQLKAEGNFLNLRNCVLDIDKGVTLPHSPDYLCTYVLPYDYSPGAKAPVWDTVVQRVMCGDADTIKAFQQAIGYLLLRSFNCEKMVGFVGEGENGKSTVLRVIKKLIGRSGYSSEPIKILVKDSSEGAYSRAKLAGKLVNITNELSPGTLEADAFKDLISGEDITARNIFEAPFTLSTVPKQVVAMNTTESLIKERTHGFMRRLHLIPFNYTLKEEHKDPDLDKKLDAELSGILNWCLEGAREVIKNGKLAKSLAMKRLFDDVKRDSNPCQQFVEEHLEAMEGEVEYDTVLLSGSVIHHAYTEFCRVNGYFPLGRNKMIGEIKRQRIPFIDSTRKVGDKPMKRLKGFHCKLVDTNTHFVSEVVDLIPKK